jgi:hypothetical protein
MANHRKAVETLQKMCDQTGIVIVGRPVETLALHRALVAVFNAAVKRNEANIMVLAAQNNRRLAFRDPNADLASYDEAQRNAINYASNCGRKLAKKMVSLTNLVLSMPEPCTAVEIDYDRDHSDFERPSEACGGLRGWHRPTPRAADRDGDPQLDTPEQSQPRSAGP